MRKIVVLAGMTITFFVACTKDEIIQPVAPGISSSCTPNSSDAYWREIEGNYNNDRYFLIDHDLLWCDNAKLDILIDSIQTADNITIDKSSVKATFTEPITGRVLLQVDSIYNKKTNANRLIHNTYQQYSSGLLGENGNSIATLELLFTDRYGQAIISANHPDNIVTMNFEHLLPGVIY